MLEKTSVTPLGHTLLRRRKAHLEKLLLEAQEGLVDLTEGDPGDGFQDGYLRDTQMDIQLMEQQLRHIIGLLRETDEVEIPQHTDVVSLGHRIRLHLTYPSGESEALTVVLIPSQELSLVQEHLSNGEVPVSPVSALGTAILGKSVGTTFTYGIDAGSVQGELLKIEIWRRAFEYAECYSS